MDKISNRVQESDSRKNNRKHQIARIAEELVKQSSVAVTHLDCVMHATAIVDGTLAVNKKTRNDELNLLLQGIKDDNLRVIVLHKHFYPLSLIN